MKRTTLVLAAVLSLVLLSTSSFAQATNGTGSQGQGTQINWVDANGDGICDNFGTANQGSLGKGKGYGKKDGTGNPVRPQDGTGYGRKGGNAAANATGTCDGTGPKGSARRGGRQ